MLSFVVIAISSITLTGRVVATESRRDGETIVTESAIRDASGRVRTVVQLGGVVDGIGVVYGHQPALLRDGDDVTLDVKPAGPLLVVVHARSMIAAATAGSATYGVQRTQRSSRPLWRSSGCIDLAYDGRSIDAKTAAVLDDAFHSWEVATSTCGGPSILAVVDDSATASATDDRNVVQIRRDRWCRPATDTVPEVCFPPEASAVTRLTFIDDSTSSDDGKILGFDVELNAVHFELLLPGAAATTSKAGVDLLAVATHEAGHVLGLAHNCGTGREAWPSDQAGNMVPSCEQPATSPIAQATMFYRIEPGQTGARTLEASDKQAACSIATGATCERFVEGGCSSTRGGSIRTLAVALVLLSALLRRARA